MTTNPEDTTTPYRWSYTILGLIHSNFTGLEIELNLERVEVEKGDMLTLENFWKMKLFLSQLTEFCFYAVFGEPDPFSLHYCHIDWPRLHLGQISQQAFTWAGSSIDSYCTADAVLTIACFQLWCRNLYNRRRAESDCNGLRHRLCTTYTVT